MPSSTFNAHLNRMKPALIGLAVLFLAINAPAQGGDWPMWRYDAGRTAASPAELPAELHLHWVVQYPAREPVWDSILNRDLMPYDRVFEPVVAGNTLFLPFNDTDKVAALDTATGEVKWVFYTDAPVRFAAAVADGKVYFTCDDGYLYCADAESGELVWKLRGGPSGRVLIGNHRVVSMWPARGAPVVADGTVYFAAGIFPFMGTFMYGVDAQTGAVQWLNDSDGPTFQEQPHGGAWSFGGVGPQGAFAVSGGTLLVPGGRSVPAALDRATGKMLHYRFHDNNKTGGSFVCARDGVFFNHYREGITTMYDLATGDALIRGMGRFPVLAEDAYYMSGGAISAYDAAFVTENRENWREGLLWEAKTDALGDLILAGRRLYAGGAGSITALQLQEDHSQPKIAWTKVVDGDVERLVAANGRLFAVTADGKIMAFGPEPATPHRELRTPLAAEADDAPFDEALELIARTGVSDGYGLYEGVGDGKLLEALATKCKVRFLGFDEDADQVAALRARYDDAGLYGDRVALVAGSVFDGRLPQYMSSLTVIDGGANLTAERFAEACRSLRPYGGKLCVLGAKRASLEALVRDCSVPGLEVLDDELVSREGPLPDTAQWTHLLGDIAQTGTAWDDRVRLPLGLLWFGGSPNDDVLPRHGHGPPQQVVDGRLFIQGMNSLSARDVYTGRVLWKTPLYDLGTYGIYFDETYTPDMTSTEYNQVHIPGANIRGTNFVAASDGVYVLQGTVCDVLDPATGLTLRSLRLPPVDPEADRPQYPEWGYLGVCGDLLLGGAGFVAFSDLLDTSRSEYDVWEDFDTSASKKLVVMDRATGDVLWQRESACGFLHNGTVVGGDTLYCLDKLPPYFEEKLARRGKSAPGDYRLLALDLRTGEVKWQNNDDVFGSFLAYSAANDILLQSTRPSRDTVRGEEGKRMIAYRGKDGKKLWDEPIRYPTFPLINGNFIIVEGALYELETGQPLTATNPLTQEPGPVTWRRMYGCNHPLAAKHLVTFRSGAAGYYDLDNFGGTGNWGGFKSGCTSSLIAADGVLNAPDYTRTCSCAYPNQTSVALVHMPEVEVWTFNELELGGAPLRRLGLNLGAPGDRRADDGTLWLEYPLVGGPSPEVKVEAAPEDVRWFLHHSSRFTGDLDWVGASGAEGLTRLALALSPERGKESAYTVRLAFAEPEERAPGERVFSVSLQGQRVLENFDIVREAGGVRKTVWREFKGIEAGATFTVDLEAAAGAPILCGIELVEQGL